MIYRHLLRDENRFNKIINTLNNIKNNAKLDLKKQPVPRFVDSDNYAMLLVSGDINNLGRIIKANRGVESVFGYTPSELNQKRINHLMPYLFAQIHDDFLKGFLRAGKTNFIERN